ncbi:histidine kinase dimerization/phosphoacceptor domain -containing protein [uncultured Sphingomonas sp.]|uniref:histidine kinase dimerization/phosphoacceptor domain -containing protein n=1 Tax=uncultured Sphingomonas sp. TaxID=158754 RepID=UPI0025DFE3E0|nr:histidine kinase dimerization/phosphoacceptor domain -containing protein [uncultured Sphingomonas sp.]
MVAHVSPVGVTPVAPVSAVDATACDREPIHVPGSIQPHGLLLLAERDTRLVIAGAGELEARLMPDWQGKAIADLLAQKVDMAIEQASATVGVTVPLLPVAGRGETFDASLFLSGDLILVELEPRPDVPQPAAAMLAWLDAAGASFERAANLAQLCERAAVAFRDLTGFDRVLVYRFLDDEAGKVIAEDRDLEMGSFLNHHFPGTDIPRQARALYVRNRVRVISRVDYDPAPIRPDVAGVSSIDLSDAALRSVSPVHLQYLRNMGVGASASISIVKDGLLWGLIACHHHAPRQLSYETRAACRALAGGLSRQIRAKEEAESYRERIRLRSAEEAIVARLASRDMLEGSISESAIELRALLGADGFAVWSPDDVVTQGCCPDAAQLRELTAWLSTKSSGEPFSTFRLGELFSPAQTYREAASGVVVIAISGVGQLLWFRAEQPEEVKWAGNPHKAVSTPGGELTPRASFAAWNETVRGRSRRWSVAEVEAASHLRRALIEVQQAQRLRQLNRQLNETLAEKDALLTEKEHLLREVNHRVQNSLQLVQAFLSLQAQAAGDETLAEHLGEAQRRLSAVALVHRRLYQADQIELVDLGRYLEELIADMHTAMGPEWAQAMVLDLAPVLLPADRAVHVGLILTELVINANKYAYGGQPGPLQISLNEHGSSFCLIVADQGGGGGNSTREGFGTRMMKAMVQRLGGTMEREDNHPGRRMIVTAPVEDR